MVMERRSEQPGMRRKRRRWTTLAAVCLLVALVGSACGDDDSSTDANAGTTAPTEPAAASGSSTTAGSSEPQSGPGTPAPKPLAEKTTVKVAIPQAGVEPFLAGYLADSIGEFEKENLDVSFEVLPIPETLVLMQQGKIDVSPVGFYGGLFNTIQQGGEIKIVASVSGFPDDSKSGLWVTKDLADADGKIDPCSLRGKTISFGGSAGLGATSSWWIGDFLAKCPEKLTVKDVQVSTLGGPDLLAAIQNGAVHGGFLPDPLWADPDQKGYAVQAVESYRKPLGGWAVSPAFLEDTEVVDAFVRALVRTTRTYLQGDYHKDATPEVRAAIIESLGVPEATYDAGVSLIFDPDLTPNSEPIEGVQQTWLDAGDILSYDAPLPASAIIDTSVLERVLAE
jgi:NitT/TauT family transport system substrate-binding protein